MEGIEEFLKTQEKKNLLRTLKPKPQGFIDFSSNDYLCLSRHPKLKAVSIQAIEEFGTSTSASRLLSGDLEMHHLLEEKIARFNNKEGALVFNSGYQANLGIISALYKTGDCIFSDRLNHASIIDGIILSGARFFRFQHNDMEHLDYLLKKERDKFNRGLIITESIFSMDGDKAILRDLVSLKEKYDCQLFVDEAHATGVFGKDGAGLVSEEGLEEKVDFIMGTFGKALGGFGAYLATSKKVVQYLINTCRSFIYSTSLPAGVIASNIAAVDLVKQEPYRRERLLECAAYFRDTLKKDGFKIKGSSQIVPLILGENIKAVEFSQKLQARGYWVLPIRPPTVPQGEARLRFSLTFAHTKEILERLIDDINEIRIQILE